MYNKNYTIKEEDVCRFVSHLDDLGLDWTIETECEPGYTIVKVLGLAG